MLTYDSVVDRQLCKAANLNNTCMYLYATLLYDLGYT